MSAESNPAPVTDQPEWQRLSARVIWVDLAKSLASLLPGALAVYAFGVSVSWAALWPFVVIAAWGVVGAVGDAVRWAFTRYRLTPTHVERRTGILVRRHRSARRELIRSVDTHAKLRHRLAGLRVVAIGAGQRNSAGESVLELDSLTRDDADALRRVLLREAAPPVPAAALQSGHPERDDAGPRDVEVLATLRPWWALYNMFNIWAYLTAAGLLWGAFWAAATFGIDLFALSARIVDWDELGWLGTVAVALVGGGALGTVGMGINFLATNWGLELARVRTADGSFLRTRRGLFSTREVNRDEARIRGLSIGEPLLWRWMRMADTNVITTGLGVWDMSEPTAILPRGPRGVALAIAEQALGTPSPFAAPLRPHPRTALRRRLWWATLFTLAVVGVLAPPAVTGAVPLWVLWAALGVWPLALAGAVVAYRALGHAISGEHLVVRSGLLNRTTSALRRDAVSTIAVRQSVLQRRLGLSTVSALTAAGWCIYEAPDVAAEEAFGLAMQAAPGLLEEFLPAGPTARAA